MEQNKENVNDLMGMMLGSKGAQATERMVKDGVIKLTDEQQQPPAGGNQQQQPPNPPAGNQQQQPPAGGDNQQQQPPTNEEFIETPLGKIPVKKNQAAPAPVEVSTWEDVFKQEALSKTFGRNFEKPQEFFETGIKQVQEWRSQAAQANDHKTKYDNLAEAFKALPDPVKEVVNAAIEGVKAGDNSWEKMLNVAPRIDFSKPADQVDKKLLVNTYFPNKFEAEELDDADNKAVQVALESARSLYEKDRSERERSAAEMVRQAQQRQDAVSASLNNAIEKLNNHLPIPVDEARINQVKTMMEKGSWKEALFNQDGTWKESAAANILLATNGAETLGTVMKFMENRLTTQHNEQMVLRGDKATVQGDGNGASDKVKQLSKENQDALAQMMRGKKSHY